MRALILCLLGTVLVAFRNGSADCAEPDTAPQQALQSAVSVQFVNTSLSEAIASLAEEAGTKIHINAQQGRGISMSLDAPVNYVATDVSLDAALKNVLRGLQQHLSTPVGMRRGGLRSSRTPSPIRIAGFTAICGR